MWLDTDTADAPMFSLVQAALHEHGLADQSIHLMDVGGELANVDPFHVRFSGKTATVIETGKEVCWTKHSA